MLVRVGLRAALITVTTSTVYGLRSPILQNFFVNSPLRESIDSRTMASSISVAGGATSKNHEHLVDHKEKVHDDKACNSSDEKSWRSYMETSIARTRKIRGSNYVQLATIDPTTKEPRCRTVVFRGFLNIPEQHPSHLMCDGKSCVMKMCTDVRSNKVTEVVSSNCSQNDSLSSDTAIAEIVWWFPKTTEQYRIRGHLLFIGGGRFSHDDDSFLVSSRKELWGNLSDPARESFLDENIPGDPFSDDKKDGQQKIPPGGRDEATGKLLPPPDTFLLMLLFPTEVDYLRLRDQYRQIDKRIPDGGKIWSFQRVNP